MNFFTRERYLALQDFRDEAMDAADADWEQAVADYDARLQILQLDMTDAVRQLIDGVYPHDARVLSVGQHGETFVISLRLDVPPNDLLTITYRLTGVPAVNREPFPWVKNADITDWQYDEIDKVAGGGFVHSILLGNGWELQIPVNDVQMATARPVLPHPTTTDRATTTVVHTA